MHISFRPTEDDWAALVDFQLAHSPTLHRAVRRTQLIGAIVGGGLAIAIAAATRSLLFGAIALVVAGFAWLEIPVTMKKQMRKQMRALFQESLSQGSDGETRLEIREEGLSAVGMRGAGLINWTAFHAVAESPSHAYLGLGGASGIVIPKQRILSGDLPGFMTACRSRIPGGGA